MCSSTSWLPYTGPHAGGSTCAAGILKMALSLLAHASTRCSSIEPLITCLLLLCADPGIKVDLGSYLECTQCCERLWQAHAQLQAQLRQAEGEEKEHLEQVLLGASQAPQVLQALGQLEEKQLLALHGGLLAAAVAAPGTLPEGLQAVR